MRHLAGRILLFLILCSPAWATSLVGFRANVKDLMVDSVNRFHSNASIDSAVNRAVVYVTTACSCLVEKDSVTTSSDVKEYALNNTFSAVVAVYNSTQKQPLYQIPVKDLGKIPGVASTTSPSMSQFYIWGKDPSDTLYRMGFHTTPTAEDVIWYWFYPEGKKLVGADTITNLPNEFLTAVIYRAIKELYAREHEYSKADWWDIQTEKEILRAKLTKFVMPEKIVEIPKVFKQ